MIDLFDFIIYNYDIIKTTINNQSLNDLLKKSNTLNDDQIIKFNIIVRDFFDSERLLSAFYGINDNYVNVSNIIMDKFKSEKNIIIPKNCNFNSFFDDPYFGKKKKLIIRLYDKIYTINEQNNEALTLNYEINAVTKPIITFILPTIGRPSLMNSIKSVLQQTNKNFKLIIIFDGIKNTLNLNDDRIEILEILKTGTGHNSAGEVRNLGIAKVTTEWIGFIDDDDTISKYYVENVIEEINNNKPECIVFRMMYNNGHYLPNKILNNINLIGCGHVGISFAYKKILFDKGCKFIPDECEDYHLLMKIKNNNYKTTISKYLTYFVKCNPLYYNNNSVNVYSF